MSNKKDEHKKVRKGHFFLDEQVAWELTDLFWRIRNTEKYKEQCAEWLKTHPDGLNVEQTQEELPVDFDTSNGSITIHASFPKYKRYKSKEISR